ncbi:MAG: C40 family peptidase [Ignavibacteriales bacterium]|nr:C40 family peptidase [Ignavibacteriales bacterium]
MILAYHFKPLLSRWGFSFFVLIGTLLLAGCSSSSPRFASGKTDDKQYQKRKSAIRFSSKVKEEEMREDDRKVNVKEVKARFSSAKNVVPVEKKNISKDDIKRPDAVPTTTGSTGFERQKMMDAILAWMGTPYDYGGESKSGTDCSGFTMQIFKESAGMDLPRTTEEQVKLGNAVAKDDLKFGDLIFFNTTGENPSHVGIYIGDDMFAHASVSFGVTLSSMYSSYYKKRYTEARRVIQ